MKKLILLMVLMAACSDDAAPSTTNNADTGTTADAAGDAANDTAVQADAAPQDDMANAQPDAGDDMGMQVVDTSPLGGDRPVDPFLPEPYDNSVAHPLVIVLHGYTASGPIQNVYFQLTSVQDDLGFVLLAPNGLVNSFGQRYWNATDYCCDLNQAGNDDVAYISGLIEEAKQRFNIDAKRVYLVRPLQRRIHELPHDVTALTIAGIVSLAGAAPLDTSVASPPKKLRGAIARDRRCHNPLWWPAETLTAGYPLRPRERRFWRDFNGCDAKAAPAMRSTLRPGNWQQETDIEFTTIVKGRAGCGPLIWAVTHPRPKAAFPTKVMEFLLAHPKP
ncbi:MAG: PHB depolymerase family esterase [bacterium]